MEIRRSLQTEFVETSSAKEAVLFSNTASFLLDRLRKDSSASYIAHELNTEDIIGMLKERCKTPPTNPLDLLWAYILLAALSLKDDLRKFMDSLNSIDLSQIQWGNEIRGAVVEDKPPTNILDIRYPEARGDSHIGTSTNVTSGIILNPGTR